MTAMTLGILAGGQGLRLGGRDKGLVAVGGKPLVGTLLQTYRGQYQEILISCKGNHWFYQHYADRLLCDVSPSAGPIAGILGLLSACETPLLTILPCDQLVRMPPLWPAQVIATLGGDSLGGYVVHQTYHTPCCVLHRSALGPLTRAWNAGVRSLRDAYEVLELTGVTVDSFDRDLDCWSDLRVD